MSSIASPLLDPVLAPLVVGVIHLRPLPGSARGRPATEFHHVIDMARRDAAAYAAGGADALIVENFWDAPFAKNHVAPFVVAAMTRATLAVMEESGLIVGLNVLRNDVVSGVSIAALTGARFVRANVYVGAAVTDQGVIEGDAEAVQALIRRLGAPVQVWADIDVKHAAQLAPRPIGELAQDAVERGLAAAVIVSGPATGQPAAESDLMAVREALPETPVYVGSGASASTTRSLLKFATGIIVGTAAKIEGRVANPVDVERVRAIVDAAKQTR